MTLSKKLNFDFAVVHEKKYIVLISQNCVLVYVANIQLF